uniref:ABC transporter domain-containing protein n=1 Tax=Terrapene triunguis TaxID=2587831 RepID=A0A674K916_9SAUR
MQRLQRNMSVCQQTKALLCKNLLTKWRMKMQTFQEWILSLLFLFLVYVVSMFTLNYPNPEVPLAFLGRLDDPAYNATGITVAYTPMTGSTRQIMNKVASDSVMIDSCYNFSEHYCNSPKYWYRGFLSLQSSIDAAIIEMTTNHSVWEEMKSISGVRMGSSSIIPSVTLEHGFIFFTVAMSFSPFMHFLSISLTREKRKLKALMKTMGLQDAAFWLSWSLLYTVCVLIMASLLTAVTVNEYFYTSSFFAVLLLFFFYGIASIHFCFMLSSLLKKPKVTSSVGFILTFFSTCLSFITLVKKLPAPLEWALGLLCPFAFITGISKILHLEKYGIGFYFSNMMEESYAVFTAYVLLIFDSVLYMLLAIYFDKVLPDKYGMKYPPLFCLKPSYWCKSRRGYAGKRPETEQNHERIFNDSMEPVPSEFDGKEAIRLNNIKKTYKTKNKKIEALRGLFLNIYEGQITALLGHSGAGKTTLLNILSGLSQPSDGSATIYKYKLSEIEDLEEIRALFGVCPQFNVQFEVLTVKENLRVFAEIKGIRSVEVEYEVQKVLKRMDIIKIQDTQANKLSGGQKRKLSLGIAMLGDPQVLLLDEPTAGLDPRSRHYVWTLLKERRAGRVTLFSTQFMDEADILADRKAFISHGRIKCVGSSLFLKKKWGIGYHLSEVCDSENMISLVRQYIPDATFTGQSENELSYTLPLENVDKFPDLFCGLDSHSDQGIINYGVSMTTLEDVFLKLEGEAATDQEGKILEQAEEERDTFSADEMEQGLLSLSDTGKATVTGTALWRQQVCAMARIRFLKLKHEDKTLRSMMFIAQLSVEWVENTFELLSCLAFLQSYRFTVMCSIETINCFPVLVNIISNALLRTLNSTAQIRIWSHPFFSVTRSQLRVSGLFPSAYWCGQALVDIPLYLILLFSMFGIIFFTCMIGYGASMILFMYVIAFTFRKRCNSCDFWSFILIAVSKWLDYVQHPYLHCVVFIFLLRWLEVKYGRAVMREDPIFRFVSTRINHQNPEEPEEEDEDVQAERAKVREAIASENQEEKPIIIVNDLRKEYKDKKASSVFKKRKKAATKNISFCVKKGEVFGLLGPNGAGKSTTINMITGETTLTAGQVGETESPTGFLGHCPQENPLWPNLTVQQHLEVYAAVKGLRKEDAVVTIKRIAKALELQDHVKKVTRKLSAGVTRKVCFALSMLGNPTVLLLDEPSTGMDPKGQSRMWKAIRAALKNKEQGAILTTHYMEEAEAVCDRVAIMVCGKLRCIGAVQYLKSKFGKGYLLEIKVKDPAQVDCLHMEILRIFPHADRQERVSSLLVYKIPMQEALPLSQTFSKLEAAKRTFGLEEYSFSLNTLEQAWDFKVINRTPGLL